MRVAIMGGGLTGLACAHYAERAGLNPTVFEASETCGPLSRRFRAGDQDFDCFHSPLSGSDSALCGLLAELALLHQLVWRDVQTAVYRGGLVERVDRGACLPVLRDLWLGARLRARLASRVCIRRWFRREADLTKIRGSFWLARHYGTHTYETVWAPLLHARFGENAEEVPALLVWRFLRGVFAVQSDPRGYLVGGYRALCARLRDALVARGRSLRLSTPLLGVEMEGRHVRVETEGGSEWFDAAISTLALPDLAKIASAQLLSRLPAPGLESRGVLSVVALLRRPSGLPYRVVDLDGALGFDHVISADPLLPRASRGSLSPVYLVRHCAVHGAPYRAPDALLAASARAALTRLRPDLEDREIEAVHVFRAPDVDPVWPDPAAAPRFPARVDRSRLYLCNAAQAYPREAGPETSVMLARETIERLTRDAQA